MASHESSFRGIQSQSCSNVVKIKKDCKVNGSALTLIGDPQCIFSEHKLHLIRLMSTNTLPFH